MALWGTGRECARRAYHRRGRRRCGGGRARRCLFAAFDFFFQVFHLELMPAHAHAHTGGDASSERAQADGRGRHSAPYEALGLFDLGRLARQVHVPVCVFAQAMFYFHCCAAVCPYGAHDGAADANDLANLGICQGEGFLHIRSCTDGGSSEASDQAASGRRLSARERNKCRRSPCKLCAVPLCSAPTCGARAARPDRRWAHREPDSAAPAALSSELSWRGRALGLCETFYTAHFPAATRGAGRVIA